MRTETFAPSRPPRTMWAATGWFACVAIGAAILRRSLGAEGAVAVAAVYGLGTIGMASITARSSGFPLWSWLGTSAAMALALVLSTTMFPDPRQAAQWMDMAWMFPWFFFFAAVTPRPASGWCSPRAPYAGAILFGMGLVFALVLLGVTWLPHR